MFRHRNIFMNENNFKNGVFQRILKLKNAQTGNFFLAKKNNNFLPF